ncbi:MAG TPA: tRNA (adenosine(37)-N6)-threonylcarbamoyltransferase complex dimerization subunit type 1 TsaB [Thermoanaerobaculia bacterium]|nr:tRNA (adenosine(37)-N6)-threonylcarbamoyltransferase complex dimerization subunit type 1 TsaB [Thermoanaerobaculia bacterium]
MNDPDLLLAIDAASPRVSVAVGRGSDVIADRAVEIDRSSGRLMDLIAEVLAEAGARPEDLGGVVALRGPGSFTGLRVGLATALGLHQALGVRATALSTLHVLSTLADGPVVAAVDALRGEWSAQAFNPLSEMELLPGARIPCLLPGDTGTVVGFGVSRLGELPGWPPGVRLLEAGPLAGAAVRLAASLDLDWDAGLLVRPLYSRPPAITPARPRRSLT